MCTEDVTKAYTHESIMYIPGIGSSILCMVQTQRKTGILLVNCVGNGFSFSIDWKR